MLSSLNTKQTDSLANFLYDLAKGFTLGSLGFSTFPTTTILIVRMTTTFMGILAAYFCVRMGLKFQEGRKIYAN